MAATPRTHARQHRPGQREEAEHVGVELGTDLGLVALLDARLVAVARVVDQHVDAPEATFGRLHGIGDLPRASDIQLERQGVLRVAACQVGHPGPIARGDSGTPSPREHGTRQFLAQAARAAADEPDRAVGFAHLEDSEIQSVGCQALILRYFIVLAGISDDKVITRARVMSFGSGPWARPKGLHCLPLHMPHLRSVSL